MGIICLGVLTDGRAGSTVKKKSAGRLNNRSSVDASK